MHGAAATGGEELGNTAVREERVRELLVGIAAGLLARLEDLP